MLQIKISGDHKVMSRSNILHVVKREVGVSKHVPITHLNSPSIAETKDGMVFSVLKIEIQTGRIRTKSIITIQIL